MSQVNFEKTENQITFEKNYLATMQRYAELEKTVKELQETQKQVRAEIKDAMKHYNVRSVENDFVKITRVESSTSVTIDTAAIRMARPEQYEELLARFPKTTHRESHIRVVVKK